MEREKAILVGGLPQTGSSSSALILNGLGVLVVSAGIAAGGGNACTHHQFLHFRKVLGKPELSMLLINENSDPDDVAAGGQGYCQMLGKLQSEQDQEFPLSLFRWRRTPQRRSRVVLHQS